MKKGMAVFIIFFLMIALAIFFIIQSGLKQHTGEIITQVSSNVYRSTLGAYTELLKKYAYTAFKHAAVRGSFGSAEEGGGRQWWVGYGCKLIPHLNRTKGDVMSKTNNDLNRYLRNIDGYSFEILEFNNTGSVFQGEVWVYEEDVAQPPLGIVSNGPVDERFLISTRGLELGNATAKVVTEIQEGREYTHAYTQEVWPLRFWYMWRRFIWWIENLYKMSGRVCSALDIVQLINTQGCDRCDLPGPLSKAAAARFVQMEVNALQSTFDQHVVCEGRLIDECFFSKVSYPRVVRQCSNGCKTDGCKYIQSNNPCYSWTEIDSPANTHTYCFSNEGEICTNSYHGNYQGSSCHDPWSPGERCYGYGVKQWANFYWEVQCTDYKYQNPVEPAGFKNLIFKVKGHIAWRHEVGPPNPCK